METPAISRKQNITRWNVLALIIVVTGAAITLGLSQFWIVNWSRSGVGFPIGAMQTVSLPAGDVYVYYESPHAVPAGLATLQVYDPGGNRTRVPLLPEDVSFRILFTGMSGRALWNLQVPEAGDYRFIATNENVLSDDDIPPEDRVVFLKSPNTLKQARLVQKGIMITGSSITLVLTIICYLIHLTVVSRRAAGPSVEEFEGEFELERQ